MEKEKRKRQAISLETKIDILNRIEKGERYVDIAKHFKLGVSSIRAIKKNELKIRESVKSGTDISSILSSYTRDIVLEKRIPISGYLICEKALKFYKEIESSMPTSSNAKPKQFQASNGWLNNFLKRNALHNIQIRGETASADEEAAKEYPEILKKK